MVSSSAPAVAGAAAPSTVTNVWDNHRWSIIRLLSPVVLIVVWQLLSATGLIPADVLPAPQLIFDAGWQLIQNGKLAEALEVSGVRVVEGLLLGGITGVVLGVAVGLSPWVEATVDPPLQMLRALPHLGLIPLFRSTPSYWKPLTFLAFRYGNDCASSCYPARRHRCWSGFDSRWPSRG
jgi:sulfonate transport system permease protein